MTIWVQCKRWPYQKVVLYPVPSGSYVAGNSEIPSIPLRYTKCIQGTPQFGLAQPNEPGLRDGQYKQGAGTSRSVTNALRYKNRVWVKPCRMLKTQDANSCVENKAEIQNSNFKEILKNFGLTSFPSGTTKDYRIKEKGLVF